MPNPIIIARILGFFLAFFSAVDCVAAGVVPPSSEPGGAMIYNNGTVVFRNGTGDAAAPSDRPAIQGGIPLLFSGNSRVFDGGWSAGCEDWGYTESEKRFLPYLAILMSDYCVTGHMAARNDFNMWAQVGKPEDGFGPNIYTCNYNRDPVPCSGDDVKEVVGILGEKCPGGPGWVHITKADKTYGFGHILHLHCNNLYGSEDVG
ncbi:hypothetical protein B0H63DRAFT_449942 [Podospora didyma]|uniref:Ecp2 effector protein domain-containing protein n=1 Tax=Podospora didyma TaxID=330526 RepID=A0AAE0U0B6_9PEZI|nr:hypothetical protein B0H63DRAFT_449942 [Podospora didyma]